MSDNIDAKDMSGVALQGFLDEGNTEKIVEVVDQLHHRFGTPDPTSGVHPGLVFGGLAVGLGLGGAAGYIFAQRRLETKYNELAATEIAEMREHFNAKEVARDNAQEKGNLETIVRERGYVPEPDEDEEPEQSVSPPMAVTPPSAVVERAEEVRDEEAEKPPAPEEDPEPEVRNVFRDKPSAEEDQWDWHKERSQRSPMRPYVIHVDEQHDHEAYDGVTYTYYAADDVLCNERDEVIPETDRERIVGEANLEKFGHGSNDPSIVYVRNDQLEMDIEVVHSPNSYAEEVHGFEPEIKHSDRRRGRAAFDDD